MTIHERSLKSPCLPNMIEAECADCDEMRQYTIFHGWEGSEKITKDERFIMRGIAQEHTEIGHKDVTIYVHQNTKVG